MPEPIVINGKKFITSKQAAALTGYARDYVGQLVRMGKVKGQVIEKILFVSEESLLAHVELKNSNSKVVENSFKNAIAESVANSNIVKSITTISQVDSFLPKLTKINRLVTKKVVPVKSPKLVSKFKNQNVVTDIAAKVAPYADAIGKVSSYAIKHAVGFAMVIALFSTSYASIHNPHVFLRKISEVFSPSLVTANNIAPSSQQASIISSFNSFAKKVNKDVNDFLGIGKGGTTVVQLPPKVHVATSTVTIVKEITRDIGTTTIVRYTNTGGTPVVVNNNQNVDALAAELNAYKKYQDDQLEGIFDTIARGRSTGGNGSETTIINNNAEGTTTLANLTVTNTSTSTIPNLEVTQSFTLSGDVITDFVGAGLELSNGVLTATAGSGFSTTSSNYHFDTRLAATTTLNNITNLNNVVLNNATTSSLAIGSDYITDLTGSGLTIVNGALTVSGASGFSTTSADYWETTQTRWATTSDSYAFDTQLAATSTLNNLNTLSSLASVGSSTGTTTINGVAVVNGNTLLKGEVRLSNEGTPTTGAIYFGNTNNNRLTFDGSNYMFNGSGALFTSESSIISQQNNSSLGIGAKYNASLGTVYFGATNSVTPDAVISDTNGLEIFRITNGGEAQAGYFTATSTTATSSFPNLSLTNLLIGSDYLNDITGSGLSIVGGALSVDSSTLWATTSDSYAFDTQLAATTTLNNITTLLGLTDLVTVNATTTSLSINGDYITDFTGTNLTLVDGVLTATGDGEFSTTSADYWETTQTRWATTSDSYAFDTQLIATTTLNNLIKIGNQETFSFGHATGSTLYITSLDCTLYSNGGKITTDGNGQLMCANDTSGSGGSGGGSDVNWTFFNNSGISVSTTTNQVVIGSSATSSLQRLQVSGGVYITSNLGVGTTSPSETLSINGNGLITGYVRSSYFTATSTSATSTLPLISANAITLNGNYTTSFWSTTTDSLAFDTRLAATTTLNNLTTLRGLTDTITTRATTTNATSTNFFATTASTTNQYTSRLSVATSSQQAAVTVQVTGGDNALFLGRTGTASHLAVAFEGGRTNLKSPSGYFNLSNAFSVNQVKQGLITVGNYDDVTYAPRCFGGAQDSGSIGPVFIGGGFPECLAATTVDFYASENASTTVGSLAMRITGSGNVGIGVAVPTSKLVVAGTTTAQNFVATSTTATSTFPNLSLTNLAIAGDYITDLTGSNLSIINGALTATDLTWSTTSANFWEATQTRWATTSDSYAFDTRLAATTTLNNITNLNNVVFNNATTSSLTVGSDYIIDLTGANLSIVNGALTATDLTWSTTSADYWDSILSRWATTSDSYAFDTRLAATTTLSNITTLGGLSLPLTQTTGLLSVSRGGTGQSSFGQGWLHSDGTTITSSSSPTVAYITSTSSATSTFAGGVNLNGAGCFAINGACIGGGSGLFGSGDVNKVAYWTGAGNLSYSSDFNWDSTTGTLTVPSLEATASSSVLKLSGTTIVKSDLTAGNFFAGASSGNATTTGTYNTGVGQFSLGALTTGTGNSAFGRGALTTLTEGINNVAVGYNAALNMDTGESNVAVGTNSLTNVTSGDQNVAVGSEAGVGLISGSNNLFLGYGADVLSNNLSNSSAIGYNAKVAISNAIVFGEAGIKVGVGTTTPSAELSVAGQTLTDYFTAVSTSATSTLPLLSIDALGINGQFFTSLWSTTTDSLSFDTLLAATSTLNNLNTLRGLASIGSTTGTTTFLGATLFNTTLSIGTTTTGSSTALTVEGDTYMSGDTSVGGRLVAATSKLRYVGNTAVTSYYAYGDSITEGSASTAVSNRYVNVIKDTLGYDNFYNMGVGGAVLEASGVIDNIYAQPVSTGTVATFMTGYNNHRYFGLTRLDVYKQALPVALAYLAIPDVNKVFGPNFSSSGTWLATTTYATTTGVYSREAGATLSTTLYGSTLYIAGTRGGTADTGTVTVTVDGVNKGTYSCSGVFTHSSTLRTYAPFMMRIPNLTNGPHNVVITNNNTGYCEINWAAGNANQVVDGIPAVYVGGAIRMTDAGYVSNGVVGSMESNRQHNQIIQGVIKQLASDGLDVINVDLEESFDPYTMMSGDNVHPNDYGHYVIAQTFLKKMSGTQFGNDKNFARFFSGYVPKFTIGAGTSTIFTFDGETGRFGIGTSSPTQAFSVNGNAWITGNATSSTFAATSTTASSTLPILQSTRINVATNLSIGTTSQSEQLVVGDTAVIGNELSILEIGSATDAGIYFGNDTNTGIFAPASDMFAITTAGVERITINADGDVGIGSTTPWALLSVDTTSSSATVPAFSIGSSTKTDFLVNGVNGNISMGTTTTARGKLHIENFINQPSLIIDGALGGADVFRLYRGAANGGSGNYGLALKVQLSNPSFLFRSGTSATVEGTSLNGFTHISGTNSFMMSTTSSVSGVFSGFEPMYMTNSNSNIGFAGTTTPWGSVSVNGVYQSSGEPTFVVGSSTKTDFIVQQSGFVGVGTTSPWRTFSTNGSVAMSGLTTAAGTPSSICMNTATREITVNAATTCVVSDRDQKQNIQDLTVGGLDAIRSIKPVTFAYNDIPGRSRIGFIAQDLQSVDNRLGDAFDTNGIARSIDIPAIMSITVKAVQELDTKVDTQASSTANQFLSLLNIKPSSADNFLINGDLKFKNNFSVNADNTKYLYIRSSTGDDVITFADNGNIGIGTSTPAYKLQIAGDIAATAFVNVSTRDAKKNITYLNDDEKLETLTKLGKMKIAQYRYKTDNDSDPLRLGLIAEEAPAEVLSASGKGVDIYKLTTFTLAAVQAQQKSIEAIDARLSALEARTASSTPAVSEGLIASIISSIKTLSVDKIEVGSKDKPTGITLFDEETGKPYCLKMSGGSMKSSSGACGTSVEPKEEAPKEEPKPIIPVPTQNATSTASTTAPVKETPKEPVATSTPSTGGSTSPKLEEPKVEETKPVEPTPAPEAPKPEEPKAEETKPVEPTPVPEAPKEEAPKEESKPAETASAPSVDSAN